MKTAIVYYSYSGNTDRVAGLIAGILRKKGDDVTPVRIRPLKETRNFLAQCKEAFLSGKPELYRTLLDLKDFDRIVLGSPVWAFNPAPAINTYIERCGSLEGKEVFLYVTYGSGTGKDRALDAMRKGLEARGARVAGTFSFQQAEGLESCRRKIREVFE